MTLVSADGWFPMSRIPAPALLWLRDQARPGCIPQDDSPAANLRPAHQRLGTRYEIA